MDDVTNIHAGTEKQIGDLVGESVISKLAKERAYKSGFITEPGIYRNVPMDVYHSDCCDGPSISSSGLPELTPPD